MPPPHWDGRCGTAAPRNRSLVDVKKDGQLNQDWFAVAMHLTMRTKRGEPLPKTLPLEFVPPSSR